MPRGSREPLQSGEENGLVIAACMLLITLLLAWLLFKGGM